MFRKEDDLTVNDLRQRDELRTKDMSDSQYSKRNSAYQQVRLDAIIVQNAGCRLGTMSICPCRRPLVSDSSIPYQSGYPIRTLYYSLRTITTNVGLVSLPIYNLFHCNVDVFTIDDVHTPHRADIPSD